MDDLFGSVAGLPLHPLVTHGVVVLLPLMAVLTVLVALLPRLGRGAWAVVAGNVVVTLMALVAKESGERLQAAQPVQDAALQRHAGLGDVLPLFALGVLASSVVVALLRSSSRLRWLGVVLTVVAAAAAITWTVLTGHSGAFSVWDGVEASGDHAVADRTAATGTGPYTCGKGSGASATRSHRTGDPAASSASTSSSSSTSGSSTPA